MVSNDKTFSLARINTEPTKSFSFDFKFGNIFNNAGSVMNHGVIRSATEAYFVGAAKTITGVTGVNALS